MTFSLYDTASALVVTVSVSFLFYSFFFFSSIMEEPPSAAHNFFVR